MQRHSSVRCPAMPRPRPDPKGSVPVTEKMPRWMQRLSRRLLDLPRKQKRLLMLLCDVVCIPAALWTAMSLKAGVPDQYLGEDAWLYVAALLASVPVFMHLGLYRAVVRFIGFRAMIAVFAGVT